MNAKKAKALRRAVYGEQSLRQKREYIRLDNHRDKMTGAFVAGTIINKPGTLRATYQGAKKTAR